MGVALHVDCSNQNYNTFGRAFGTRFPLHAGISYRSLEARAISFHSHPVRAHLLVACKCVHACRPIQRPESHNESGQCFDERVEEVARPQVIPHQHRAGQMKDLLAGRVVKLTNGRVGRQAGNGKSEQARRKIQWQHLSTEAHAEKRLCACHVRHEHTQMLECMPCTS